MSNATPRRNVPVGRLVAEKVAKFPARNPIWSYFEPQNKFTVEESTLRGVMLDPWNRPMPAHTSWEVWYHGRGEDREVGGWTAYVTVEGVHIELTIFND
jgi:hypothetical protein